MPERTPRQIYATQKRALTSMQKKLEAMASHRFGLTATPTVFVYK